MTGENKDPLENEDLNKTEEELEPERQQELTKLRVDNPDLTDEELDALLAEDEANRLEELGFPQFKTFKEMAENFKKFLDEDKMTFPIVKELAAELNYKTPHDFIQAVKAQIKKSSPPKADGLPKGKDPYDDRFRQLEADRGDIHWDLAFDKFQRKMEKGEDGVEIPNKLKGTLKKLIPAVLADKTRQELEDMDPEEVFEDAYDLYLWKLSKEKSPEKLKSDLSELELKRLKKLRQLKMPSGKTTTKGGNAQDIKDFGAGITSLPPVKGK